MVLAASGAPTPRPKTSGHVGPYTTMSAALKTQLTQDKACWYCHETASPPHTATKCPKKARHAKPSSLQRVFSTIVPQGREQDDDFVPMLEIADLFEAEQSAMHDWTAAAATPKGLSATMTRKGPSTKPAPKGVSTSTTNSREGAALTLPEGSSRVLRPGRRRPVISDDEDDNDLEVRPSAAKKKKKANAPSPSPAPGQPEDLNYIGAPITPRVYDAALLEGNLAIMEDNKQVILNYAGNRLRYYFESDAIRALGALLKQTEGARVIVDDITDLRIYLSVSCAQALADKHGLGEVVRYMVSLGVEGSAERRLLSNVKCGACGIVLIIDGSSSDYAKTHSHVSSHRVQTPMGGAAASGSFGGSCRPCGLVFEGSVSYDRHLRVCRRAREQEQA
ncbi:hypothetical protein P153DRAFT_391011 [Dothidotthia symphoricarpi CBS 119687]|uniref:Uncharacterized protein n=1 Tax=Dothidotthia symphoricarpi CBS 119687 TaxID=1392245 RepID=A0A6A5ZW59_9PLEO|nr:uncharacterized protein P153DRAFT_391011 [Dothidotthia symphoricarpi CBS 119687]KAF2123972.1 hypothetical protein P153DRAFT_391011 [Dothidotthia symphoricarpi CBS 119687]